MTRSTYLKGGCTHREYYAQFVTPEVTRRVLDRISSSELLKSTDPHFNDIQLHRWDRIFAGGLPEDVVKKMREEGGEHPSLSSAVCISKEAARQIVETLSDV